MTHTSPSLRRPSFLVSAGLPGREVLTAVEVAIEVLIAAARDHGLGSRAADIFGRSFSKLQGWI